MLQRRTKDGFWEIRIMRGGKTYYKNSFETVKTEARKREDQFITEINAQRANEKWDTVPKKAIPTLCEFIERFVETVQSNSFHERKLAPRTQTFYLYHAERLAANPELAAARLDLGVGFQDLINIHAGAQRNAKWKRSKKHSGFSEHTLRDDKIVTKRIFKYAASLGIIAAAPQIVIAKVPKSQVKHKPHKITPAEEEAFLKVCRPDHRDCMVMLFHTGLRPEEVVRLKPTNLREGYVVIDFGKTDAANRSIPATPEVVEIFGRSGPEWVFPNPRTMSGHIEPSTFRKQAIKARTASGVPKFVIDDVRRTTLKRWSKRGGDRYDLQELAGHTSPATTGIYVDGDDKSKRDMVLGPKAKEEKAEPKRKAPKRARKNEKSPEAIMLR